VRRERLISWQRAPAARVAHPREDHLIPLMVAVGAAEQETAHRIYHEDAFFGGVVVSSYRIGDAVTATGTAPSARSSAATA
jgi:aromatic ring-opening dioxygenase catalytic subunit (LigB family)